MDLSLILVGALSAVGFNLNQSINSRETKVKRTAVPPSEIPEGVYSNKTFKRVHKEEKSRLDKFYEESPFIVNTNQKKVSFNEQGKKRVQPDAVNFIQKQSYTPTDQKIYVGPMFNGYKFSTTEKEDTPFKETFDNTGLIGNPVTTHSNMMPFFGAHVKETRDVGKLSRYSGERGHKKEVVSEFNPKENIHQLMNNDLLQSRVNEGRYYSNVLPFGQDKVKPIPEEYTRVDERSVNELRTLNNPRTENEARFNVGSGNYTRAQSLGERDVNFIPRAFETRENYPATNEAVIGNLVTNYRAKVTNKNVTALEHQRNPAVDYTGNATVRVTDIEGQGSYATPGKKTDNCSGGFRNAGTNIQIIDPYRQKYIYAPGQERETTSQMRLGNGTDGVFGQRVAPIDKARTTIKELTNYSYIPGANSTGEFKPSSRQHLDTFDAKTRVSTSHIPSGSTKEVNLVMPNLSTKDKAYSTDYLGGASTIIKNSEVIGKQSKKHKISEHDFSDRIR